MVEFVKSCLDGEAVAVKEVGRFQGWLGGKSKEGWKANHSEKGDGMVLSGLVIVMLCKVALTGVFKIRFESWMSR